MKYKDLSQHFQRLFRKKNRCQICGALLTRYSDITILQCQDGLYRYTSFVHKECYNGKEEEKEKEGWKEKRAT